MVKIRKKSQFFMIFMKSEIDKIDLEAFIFQNFQNPNGENSDLQIKCAFLRAEQILRRPIFKFQIKTTFFGYAFFNAIIHNYIMPV